MTDSPRQPWYLSELRRLLAGGVSYRECEHRLGVSRGGLYRAIKRHGMGEYIAPRSDEGKLHRDVCQPRRCSICGAKVITRTCRACVARGDA